MSERSDGPTGRKKVRLAAMGDLHVTETSEHRYRDLFAEISEQADVLALCGDLTNFGKTREAEILAEDLRACTIPSAGVPAGEQPSHRRQAKQEEESGEQQVSEEGSPPRRRRPLIDRGEIITH